MHAVATEVRERVSKAYAQMDEIDGISNLSREEKQHKRCEVADPIGEFEVSKTLVRAREAARCDGSLAMLKALEEAETAWERAMNKIAERAGRPKAPGGTRSGALISGRI